MKASIRVLAEAKRDETAADNMDASWPDRDWEAEGPVLRVAMADGATEHLLSGPWAAQLVTTLGRAPMRTVSSCERFAREIGVCCASWIRSLTAYVEERNRRNEPLEWFEASKLWDGSAATVLAIFFRDGSDVGPGTDVSGTWEAAAIGDTNLFRVRTQRDGGYDTLAFPLTNRAEFDDRPPLLLSVDSRENTISKNVVLRSGDWRTGDAFFLATDALAAWICGSWEAGRAPWPELNDVMARRESFASWLERKRGLREIRDDDVTLLRVTIH